ncbi:MAG: hypothetical protein SWO11_15400 [Thermodesulfobacteriota bacterium]|nr:hypothetical protein [Thermodesulfobacteriota bacterium]
MGEKIVIEQYVNFNKSIDIIVYRGGKLIDFHNDCTYDRIDKIIDRIKKTNTGSEIEQFCYGELCTGSWMRWQI